jgi:hypothetical protein
MTTEPDFTRDQCIDMLHETYTAEGVRLVLAARMPGEALIVDELLATSEGRSKVYYWALGLAEGVMG